MSRWGAGAFWVAIVAVAFGLGPPNRHDLGGFLMDMFTGRWAGHPPWLVAQFQMMGLWPMLVGLQLRGEWRGPRPAWPFVLGSFALGCFALVPWFVLRAGERRAPGGSALGHPALPVGLGLAGLALAGWAMLAGSAAEWVGEVRSDGFTWAMTVDFLAFWVVSVTEARARAGRAPWALTGVPLVGLAAWLALEAKEGAWRSP